MHVPFNAVQVLQEMKNLWRGQIPHEEDFFVFQMLSQSVPAMTMLDCGANSGQSAISFLMNCPRGRVISYEPNLLYEAVLDGVRKLLGENRFEYHMVGLSNEECDLDLYIPIVDSVPYLQEASLDLAQFEKPWVADRFRSYGDTLEIKIIRSHFVMADANNWQVDAVKIDAEGAEMRVLQGMRDTISRCSPVLLIENNDWSNVTEFLGGFGYAPYQWDLSRKEVGPMRGASTNCFYFKGEHAEIYPCLRYLLS